ncbi:hypothetical protein LQ51_01690 [Micromonospora sp. HK10]|nr:hypothetical protein LQ51_01690 [Micromonospora sp. HK10]
MTVTVGLLGWITGRCLPSTRPLPGVGQRVQAAEREAARQRLLDEARGTEHHPTADGEPLDLDRDPLVGRDE